MEYEWIITDNFIFCYNLKNINGYKKLLLFDLDNTIIKTKSNKVFPINKDDWQFQYLNIPNIINNNNNINGIITNQKGLKNKEKKDDWIYKIKNILKEIKFNFIFASIKYDRFRKPMIGSSEYIKDFLMNNGIKIDKNKYNNNKIYYIGDAYGRETDHSDTDIKFAKNCKFKFKLPEHYFGITKIKQEGSITYPILSYYNKEEEEELITNIYNLIETNKKIIIMFIGYPASGKSFIRKKIIDKYNYFKYYNRDDLIKKEENKNLVIKLEEHDYIIDDNTNLESLKRKKELDKFKNYYKIGIYFNYEIEQCIHLNYMRMYWFGKELVNKVTYNTLRKKVLKEEIKLDKEFDKVIIIDKILNEFNYDDKIRYYF